MQAKIRVKKEVTVLELEGHIDFETARPFRDQCIEIISQAKESKPQIIFNMKSVKFVGSSGLSSFIQTLKEFNKLGTKPRFCGVSSEFKKMFKIYSPEESFEIFGSEDEAENSFEGNA